MDVVARKTSTNSVLLGLLAALGATLLPACHTPPPSHPHGPDIRLLDLMAFRHVGESLEATAKAKEAILRADGSAASLHDGSLTLVETDLTVSAPTVDLDLVSSEATGHEGASVVGPGYSLTGHSFELSGEEATLKLVGAVSAIEKPSTSAAGVAEKSTSDVRGEQRSPLHASGAASPSPSASARDSEPLSIDADEVTLHRRTGKAVFSGNVRVVRSDLRLTSRTLTVTYGEGQRITHLLAEGDVRVTEEDRVITASQADFDNIREVLTLTGNAVLTEGENVIRGDRVIFDLVADEVRIEKVRARVRVQDASPTTGGTE